jgi:hypothetical protein
MDRDSSIADRRGERSPLAERLARRSMLPDRPSSRQPRPPRLRPRESAAFVVVLVAALLSALATSGTGWGIPLRAADETATEAAQVDVPTAEPPTAVPTDPPTATIELEPTATEPPAEPPTETPTPAEPPTPTPVESAPTASPTQPSDPTEEPAAPTDVPHPEGTRPDEQPSPASPEPTPPPADGETPASTPVDTATPDPAGPAGPMTTPATATEAIGEPPSTPPTEVPAESETPTPQATEPVDLATPIASPVASPVASPDSPATAEDPGESTAPLVLALSPGEVRTADPGTAVELVHRLTLAEAPAEETRLALRLTTGLGWPASVSLAGESLPLWDGNGDGVIELRIGPGQAVLTLVARVETPAGALAGVRESIGLAVWPVGGSPEAAVAAADQIVVDRVLTVRVEPDTTPFGRVAPDGSLDPNVEGVSSVVDPRGAWYFKERAVIVSVTTNAPVEMACQTVATDGEVAGHLAWRLTGTTTWTTFGAIGSGPGRVSPGWCLPPLEPGVHLFVFDVRLRVNWTDPPGSFTTELDLTPLDPPNVSAVRPDPVPES